MKKEKVEEKDQEWNAGLEEQDENAKEINVTEELNRLSEGVTQFKDAVIKLKGAEIKVKDWTFSISHSEEQYDVDFKLKMSIKPKKM